MASVLNHLLSRRTSTRRSFKSPYPFEDTYNILLGCIQADVIRRGREFLYSEQLQDQVGLVAKWLTSENPKHWLLLCGNCGNGKTTMIKALGTALSLMKVPTLDEYGYEYSNNNQNSRPVLKIYNAVDIFNEERKGYESFKKFSLTPMLGIDDMGIEPVQGSNYGNAFAPIVELLTRRYEEQLFTVISTNLDPSEIYGHYGERIADRFNEVAEKVVFRNGSYRK